MSTDVTDNPNDQPPRPPLGPYRVGRHSPLNIWCDPADGVNQQVAMATTEAWARVIVDGLNMAYAAEVNGTECTCPARHNLS